MAAEGTEGNSDRKDAACSRLREPSCFGLADDELHLRILTGRDDPAVQFQVFSDTGEGTYPPQTFHCTLPEAVERLGGGAAERLRGLRHRQRDRRARPQGRERHPGEGGLRGPRRGAAPGRVAAGAAPLGGDQPRAGTTPTGRSSPPTTWGRGPTCRGGWPPTTAETPRSATRRASRGSPATST